VETSSILFLSILNFFVLSDRSRRMFKLWSISCTFRVLLTAGLLKTLYFVLIFTSS